MSTYPGPQPPVPPRQPQPPLPPAIQPLPYATPGAYGVACPRCGNPASKKVSFTWWGGLIGPKILNHVKCLNCGAAYNGKTGRSNTTGIIIYSLVALAISIIVLAILSLVAWA